MTDELVQCIYCGGMLSRSAVPGDCPHCKHDLKVVTEWSGPAYLRDIVAIEDRKCIDLLERAAAMGGQ